MSGDISEPNQTYTSAVSEHPKLEVRELLKAQTQEIADLKKENSELRELVQLIREDLTTAKKTVTELGSRLAALEARSAHGGTTMTCTDTTSATKKTIKTMGLPRYSLLNTKPARVTPEQNALQNELITACEKGQLEEVSKLISHGADLLIPNPDGKLPLGSAIWSCNMALVTFLENEIPNLRFDYWQTCHDTNRQVYGSLVPEVPPLDEIQTYGNLYKLFVAQGGRGYGMYSEWFHQQRSEASEADLTHVKSLSKQHSKIQLLCQTYTNQFNEAGSSFTIDCADCLNLQWNIEPNSDVPRQYNYYKEHVIPEMANYVEQKISASKNPVTTP